MIFHFMKFSVKNEEVVYAQELNVVTSAVKSKYSYLK